jgi:hypothetical protein
MVMSTMAKQSQWHELRLLLTEIFYDSRLLETGNSTVTPVVSRPTLIGLGLGESEFSPPSFLRSFLL